MNQALESLTGWIFGLPNVVHTVGGVVVLVLAGVLLNLFVKGRVVSLLSSLAERTSQQWDDIVLEHGVLDRLAQAVPALVVYFGVAWVPGLGESLSQVIANVAMAWLALAVTLAVGALLSAGTAIYETWPVARDRPIKGFVQVAQIAVYILGAIFVVSALMARSPVVLLTGFGAMTAILLLVFRDTILSLVASIQLTTLDMVRVGDWIEMPQYDADGDVVDIALHTIRVQNWDKTITTIPTHKLISESFRNWRGMQDSGGRRIKRSINIDAGSVRFLTDEEVEKFTRFTLLRDYIHRKRNELAAYNAALDDPRTANVNLRRLTNLGTFRAYLWNYLQNHPQIHHGMTLLVRQLQPGEKGIPIEIYCFTGTTEWAVYEGIQADIFDHVLAQCGEFGLSVFQAPSGTDIAALRGSD
ncbi:MAG: mechanosensitive ion channel [Rhodospirillaceae bacterium]|nr:mechanosensitive ion channel [Rhodospirillaceae bacterium]